MSGSEGSRRVARISSSRARARDGDKQYAVQDPSERHRASGSVSTAGEVPFAAIAHREDETDRRGSAWRLCKRRIIQWNGCWLDDAARRQQPMVPPRSIHAQENIPERNELEEIEHSWMIHVLWISLKRRPSRRRWERQRARALMVLRLLRQYLPTAALQEVEEFLSSAYGCNCLHYELTGQELDLF